jgi:prephenate dehydrogenase
MFEQITVLGPGLLGASILKATHTRGLAKRVVAWAHREERATQCASKNWCSAAYATHNQINEALKDADLVILATPVNSIISLLHAVGPHLKVGALVTDTGSTKTLICTQGISAFPKTASFVGSHPMAGSEKSGLDHADAKLFENRTCLVTPTPETNPKATECIVRFWENLGMNVTCISPEAHDQAVANISHLPQILASCLCAYLGSTDTHWHRFSGGGLRDTSRIASSPPGLWKEIILQNRSFIVSAIEGLESELRTVKRAILDNDEPRLAQVLTQGKAYRDKLEAFYQHTKNALTE